MSDSSIDVLITRAVDGMAETADWDRLERAARDDARTGVALVRTLRDQAVLEHALTPQLDASERIEVTTAPASERGRGVLSLVGWAAAVLVTLSWIATTRLTPPPPSNTSGAVSPIAMDAPMTRDVIDRYLETGQEKGWVLGVLPTVLVESTPTDDGVEVVYLRRVIERVVVDDLYELNPDELGRPQPVRVTPPPTESAMPGLVF